MSFGQVFFIKFVFHLPKWASGDKNLCSTLLKGILEISIPVQVLEFIIFISIQTFCLFFVCMFY